MRDRDLYAKILGISAPWHVSDVVLDVAAGRVEVFVEHRGEASCPKCGKPCAGYDARRRRWRHLDTCQFQTYLTADVPRVECAEHGVSQAATPWAEPGSRFTALLEAVVIDWLKEASFSAVARRLGLTWDEVDGIMSRAVGRGLARRDDSAPARIGLDETSFQKRHEDVTVVTDLDGKRVLSVVDGRTKDAVDAHFAAIPAESREAVEVVAMDMWRRYMDAAAKWLPNARVCFDRFHVARHLGEAVNAVRKQEHKRLRAEGDGTLTGTKYLWLESPASMRPERRTLLGKLKDVCTRTGRAWALKEAASRLWDYVRIGWARKAWLAWTALASRSKLEPMVRAARMIRTHLEGILNAVVLGTTNAAAESMNARIQRIKRMACGYRNRERFRNAILFHLGGLDLHPRPVSAHTIS
jgi:transposase